MTTLRYGGVNVWAGGQYGEREGCDECGAVAGRFRGVPHSPAGLRSGRLVRPFCPLLVSLTLLVRNLRTFVNSLATQIFFRLDFTTANRSVSANDVRSFGHHLVALSGR